MIKHIIAAIGILIILQLAYGQPEHGKVIEIDNSKYCTRCLVK